MGCYSQCSRQAAVEWPLSLAHACQRNNVIHDNFFEGETNTGWTSFFLMGFQRPDVWILEACESRTVEALLTHTPPSQLWAMGYQSIWAFRMLLKVYVNFWKFQYSIIGIFNMFLRQCWLYMSESRRRRSEKQGESGHAVTTMKGSRV